jgi:protein-tyrosine phosphatase
LKKILFVCSGNTCRSPLAEAIAKNILPGRLDFRVDIASAGASALEGSPASQYSIEVGQAHALDLSTHRARLLTPALIRGADLVVTMGARHREMVGTLDPDTLDYAFLLTNFSDHHFGDIPDPIGGGLETYERTYQLIRDCVESMASRLSRFDGWKSPSAGGAS